MLYNTKIESIKKMLDYLSLEFAYDEFLMSNGNHGILFQILGSTYLVDRCWLS